MKLQDSLCLENQTIIKGRTKPHAYSSGNNEVLPDLQSKFTDSKTWDELAGKHIPAFNLPTWNIRCTPERMTLWLERLGFTEKSYQQYTNTSLEEFVELNQTWPLRAFIGTVLEMRESP